MTLSRIVHLCALPWRGTGRGRYGARDRRSGCRSCWRRRGLPLVWGAIIRLSRRRGDRGDSDGLTPSLRHRIQVACPPDAWTRSYVCVPLRDCCTNAARDQLWRNAADLRPEVLYFPLPSELLLTAAVASAAPFYAHVYFDREYHISDSRFGRFAWFRRKQQLHFTHHLHANSNFAVIDFFWDRLLGTYRRPDRES